MAAVESGRGNRVIGVVADTLAMAPQHRREAAHGRQLCGIGQFAPRVQALDHRLNGGRPGPELLELFFQAVDDVEVFVGRQEFLQASRLPRAQALGVLEQQIAAARQHVLVGSRAFVNSARRT